MDYALELTHLSKTYKKFELNDITLAVPSGSIMGIIGENGTGKSTMIRLILNLLQKDNGTISIFGKSIETHEQEVKQDIGIIFDSCPYLPKMKPAQLDKMMRGIYKNWDGPTFYGYLERFNLPLDMPVEKFSKGMKMKLCFATELAHQPKLLILDEATSGLDPLVRDEILGILQEFVEEEDHTVILSTHITSDLDKIADYITFIHEGRLLFTKTYEDIHDHFGILRCGQKLFEALPKDEIIAYKKEEFEWKVLIADRQGFSKVYQDAVIDKASIEDLMLMYVKGEQAV